MKTVNQKRSTDILNQDTWIGIPHSPINYSYVTLDKQFHLICRVQLKNVHLKGHLKDKGREINTKISKVLSKFQLV